MPGGTGKLIFSQDRAAVGRWIEGQADWVEGQRILCALPQLRRGEGWIWTPGNGVLARVAFPRILTLDSSQMPPQETRDGKVGLLAAVDARLGRPLAAAAGRHGRLVELYFWQT